MPIRSRICRSGGGRLNHYAKEAVGCAVRVTGRKVTGKKSKQAVWEGVGVGGWGCNCTETEGKPGSGKGKEHKLCHTS